MAENGGRRRQSRVLTARLKSEMGPYELLSFVGLLGYGMGIIRIFPNAWDIRELE